MRLGEFRKQLRLRAATADTADRDCCTQPPPVTPACEQGSRKSQKQSAAEKTMSIYQDTAFNCPRCHKDRSGACDALWRGGRVLSRYGPSPPSSTSRTAPAEKAMSIYQDIAFSCSGCAGSRRPPLPSRQHPSAFPSRRLSPLPASRGPRCLRSSLPSRFPKRSEYPKRITHRSRVFCPNPLLIGLFPGKSPQYGVF